MIYGAIIACCAVVLALVSAFGVLVNLLLTARAERTTAETVADVRVRSATNLQLQLDAKTKEWLAQKGLADELAKKLAHAESLVIVGLPTPDLLDHVNGLHKDGDQRDPGPGDRGGGTAAEVALPELATPVAPSKPGRAVRGAKR